VTGEQTGPDVVQPYAAYGPPGTPQVGLETPSPCSSWLQPRLLPTLTQGHLKWGSAPPFTEFPHSLAIHFLPLLVIQ
jgi:hypothetical protein